MIITDNLNNEQLLNCIYAAVKEYDGLLGKKYLIIGQNKKEPFYWFECVFDKRNFMHLLGIKSKKYTAEEFYDKCASFVKGFGEGIMISDCNPAYNHSRKTINTKASCLADMLRIKDAKYMKVGDKDLISQNVDFKYAYGSSATMGFYEDADPFPITLLPNSIENYSSNRHKIILVFEKNIDDELYCDPYVELTEGIFEKVYEDFPEDLKTLFERNNQVPH